MCAKRLTFLYEATKVVPQNECGTFIRCQLLSKCHSVTNVNLPAQNFKATIMCQACGIEFSDVPPRTLLKSPPKPTKVIKKIEKMINKKETLTPYLKNVYKSFTKKNYQQLITICTMCNKRHIVKMKKPEFNSLASNNKNKQHIPQSVKNKKKDLFSGLNRAAVLSVTQNSLKKKKKNKTQINENITNNKIIAGTNFETLSNNNFIPLDSTSRPSCSVLITKNYATEKRQVHVTINNNNNRKTQKPKKKDRRKNRIQSGRIQKNEVLRKTETDIGKKEQNLKNLAKILKQNQGSSNSLSDFLKNL